MASCAALQEQRLADLMRVLQNRYTSSDGQSYSGVFSSGWTSGALSRLDDTANLKSKVSGCGCGCICERGCAASSAWLTPVG